MASVGRKKGIVSGVLTIVPGGVGVPAYLGFSDPGGGPITVSTYDAAGHYIEDIAEITGALTGSFYISIPTDSFGGVGDGAIVCWESDGTITTIDPVAGVANNFAALTATYEGLGVGYAAGWLYFIEAAPLVGSTTTIRLRKVRTDGSGLTTVSSVAYAPSIIILGEWSQFTGLRMTPTSVISSATWVRQDGSDGEDMIFPLDGSTPTIQERVGGGGESGESFIGVAYPSGSFGTFDFTGKSTAPDTVHASWTTAWASNPSTPSNVDVNATEAMSYGDGANSVHRGLFASFSGSPTTTIPIEAHPVLMSPPNLVFMLP